MTEQTISVRPPRSAGRIHARFTVDWSTPVVVMFRTSDGGSEGKRNDYEQMKNARAKILGTGCALYNLLKESQFDTTAEAETDRSNDIFGRLKTFHNLNTRL